MEEYERRGKTIVVDLGYGDFDVIESAIQRYRLVVGDDPTTGGDERGRAIARICEAWLKVTT